MREATLEIAETMEMLAGARAFLDPDDDEDARTRLSSTIQIMVSGAMRLERVLIELDEVRL